MQERCNVEVMGLGEGIELFLKVQSDNGDAATLLEEDVLLHVGHGCWFGHGCVGSGEEKEFLE